MSTAGLEEHVVCFVEHVFFAEADDEIYEMVRLCRNCHTNTIINYCI